MVGGAALAQQEGVLESAKAGRQAERSDYRSLAVADTAPKSFRASQKMPPQWQRQRYEEWLKRCARRVIVFLRRERSGVRCRHASAPVASLKGELVIQHDDVQNLID